MGTIYGHILKWIYKFNRRIAKKEQSFIRTDRGNGWRLVRDNLAWVLAAIIIGAGLTFYISHRNGTVQTNFVQEEIAEEIIRFHVLANSDSSEDQALKLKVKDAVVTMLGDKLSDVTSKAEAKIILEQEIDQITDLAKKMIAEEGYSYDVTTYLTKHYFPVKVYGDLAFPSGEYDALRIEIGQAKGKNWWCVMYPPLCLVNGTYSIVPEESKEKLKYVLTEDEYNSLLMSKDDKIKVKIKFKLLDALFQ